MMREFYIILLISIMLHLSSCGVKEGVKKLASKSKNYDLIVIDKPSSAKNVTRKYPRDNIKYLNSPHKNITISKQRNLSQETILQNQPQNNEAIIAGNMDLANDVSDKNHQDINNSKTKLAKNNIFSKNLFSNFIRTQKPKEKKSGHKELLISEKVQNQHKRKEVKINHKKNDNIQHSDINHDIFALLHTKQDTGNNSKKKYPDLKKVPHISKKFKDKNKLAQEAKNDIEDLNRELEKNHNLLGQNITLKKKEIKKSQHDDELNLNQLASDLENYPTKTVTKTSPVNKKNKLKVPKRYSSDNQQKIKK